MLIAIRSLAFSCTSCGGASTASLEAQLARYQKELSDHINCSSAKTLEGKTAIQAISNKICAVRTRIEELENAKSGKRSAMINAQTSAAVSTNNEAAVSMAKDRASVDTASASRSANASVGSQLDVFA